MKKISSILTVGLISVLAASPALAETVASGAAENLKLSGPIGIGLAALGGALGQGKIIAAALESIARNPGASGQMFLPWILGVALVESLVILSFLIAGGLI